MILFPNKENDKEPNDKKSIIVGPINTLEGSLREIGQADKDQRAPRQHVLAGMSRV